MSQVDIRVNDRFYKVTCEDGQEDRLQELAAHLNGHISDLAAELGQIGEARLILLAALTICDELFEARARLAALEKGAERLDPESLAGASRLVEAVARRVSALGERLEHA